MRSSNRGSVSQKAGGSVKVDSRNPSNAGENRVERSKTEISVAGKGSADRGNTEAKNSTSARRGNKYNDRIKPEFKENDLVVKKSGENINQSKTEIKSTSKATGGSGGSSNRGTSESSKIKKIEEPQKVSESRVDEGTGGTENDVKNGKKGKSKKQKTKPSKPLKEFKKMTAGRVFSMILVGTISSVLIGGITCRLYYKYIRYPSGEEVIYEGSGLEALDDWIVAIKKLNNDSIKGITGSESYLAKEIEYANGVSYKEDFIKKMVSTVSYEPGMIEAVNVYGNPLLDENDEVVYRKSLVTTPGEEVVLHYVDYGKVELDATKIRGLMKDLGISVGDVDYSNKLVEVFCKYILSLEDIPTTSVPHVPELTKSGEGYKVLPEEDIFLDKALFSSEEFRELLKNFSLIASGGTDVNPEWEAWSALPDDERAKTKEPSKVSDTLQPRKEWLDWYALPNEEKVSIPEPTKYDYKKLISTSWCGSYYLSNEHSSKDSSGNIVKDPIGAKVGDGTLDNPAGFNTDIVTSIYTLEEAEDGSLMRVAKPIRVSLIDYGVSQKAIDYFESKDERNRGFDVKSEVQYAYYTFEITNLSDSELTVYDDSSLADNLANLAPRTGTIYGLQDIVILQPDEKGVIESWGSSTELNLKYLIWGSDFNREQPVVWFRVLAGDVDDDSEDKGVTLNKSRYDKD